MLLGDGWAAPCIAEGVGSHWGDHPVFELCQWAWRWWDARDTDQQRAANHTALTSSRNLAKSPWIGPHHCSAEVSRSERVADFASSFTVLVGKVRSRLWGGQQPHGLGLPAACMGQAHAVAMHAAPCFLDLSCHPS
jgi:hypothetical protein